MKTSKHTAGFDRPSLIDLGPRPLLRPRRHYPTLAVVPLHAGPLRKLAWVFGFGRGA